MDRRQFLLGSAAAAAVAALGATPATAGVARGLTAPDASPPGSQAAPTWWRKYWTGGVAPASGRTWNAGCFNYYGADQTAYTSFMGARPEFLGTNCTGYGAAIPRATTWDKVIGGPTSAGPDAIAPDTQPDLRKTALASWPAGTWGGLYLTVAPMGLGADAAFATWQEIGRGLHNAKYRLMGQRFAKAVRDAGRPIDDVIMRPNWEFNQDTALRPNFYRTCRERGRTTAQATALYNDMMENFAASFREGYGHRMPIALSPAMQSVGVEFVPYEDWLAADGVYDLVCASFHPIPERCRTPEDAQTLVYGRDGWYTPGLAVRTAMAHGLGACFLEHSCDFLGATGSSQYFDDAYRHFGQLLASRPNWVAFTGVLNRAMVTPTAYAGTPHATHWSDMVGVHQRLFGKK